MYKNIKYFLFLAFISIFVSACGGRIELKSTTGVKYFFEKENIYCDPSTLWNQGAQKRYKSDKGARVITCRANGYKVDLVGNKYHASTEDNCWLDLPTDGREIDDYKQFACVAAIKSGELENRRRNGTPYN